MILACRPFSQRKKAGGARSPPQEADKPKPPILQEEVEKEPRLPPRPSEPESPPSRVPPRIPGSDQPTEEPPIPERPPFFKWGSRAGGTSQPPAESAPEIPGRPPTSHPPPTESALPVRPPPSRPPPMESTPEPPKITGRPPPTHHPGYPPPDTRGPPPPEMRPPPPEMRAPPPPSEQLVPARPPKPAQQVNVCAFYACVYVCVCVKMDPKELFQLQQCWTFRCILRVVRHAHAHHC